ncbi:MAG: tricarballylate utilization 4Fe-4S protein TcuB [Paracoccaceae bacterium]|jgi:citrate/tricarballylate utilization protein|nr:tricarballylate utilization 4Fe-4S protein TcuB [Paracoccaceae bacterium]MDP5346607.1 tricarballylate utilization 4Fe-4S protein TcuB [Paracoccaceae bacterium]
MRDETVTGALAPSPIPEARRQIEICNACRYCEGYCDVFPAMTRSKAFADGDLSHLANLCHNCRGCYYACQYTEPHAFALNLPAALAEVRQDSWERLARPQIVARVFHKSGLAMSGVLVVGLAAILWALAALGKGQGAGFYASLSHNAMVAIFAPAFVFPLISIALSLRAYWREVGGSAIRLRHLIAAARSAGELRNLSGGQGQGCNFEDGDRFSNARRRWHHLVLYGFLLCFAATSTATLMHYLLDMQAPYGLFSLPKLLGLPGGVMLAAGTLGLMVLKLRADPALGVARVWGGEMGFVALLFTVAVTGLVLYGATGSAWVPGLLALHLGAVLAFFLLMPFSKMIHGFYRFAALIVEEQKRDPAA